jgi:midasin
MNPATDVGKKDLPPNLRARFTELYVPPPDDDREALTTIVAQYLGDATAGDRGVILDVVELYTTLKRLSATKEIVDGSNTAPHFSMRTLARALMFAVQTAPLFGLRRGLWEGCLMAFTMSLDADSCRKAHEVCERYLLTPMKNARAVLSQIPTLPAGVDADDYIRFGPFWLQRGPIAPVGESRYIITPSVQAKLSDLARVIMTHRYPVLIQGPTSAGKTSAVEFLARQTGHRFVRINNHEHTDIQEYLGTYVTDPQTGNLVFQEGLLVTAVREGHWIVLDELNLAPTDVLEALNRLLDDNRELVIPETQEVITPHPNFILFATQNPPGLYAGRKVLSRAFRNRFLEVHFDDVPKDELETILCQRCQIAPSYAKKIVMVFEELRHRRQASRVFESKGSFATLRDLFRWAERGAVGYERLAEDGYMLLAERARQDEDKEVIKGVVEDIMKVSVDNKRMYRLFDNPAALARLPFDSVSTDSTTTMVWTNAMQRLFVLVAAALAKNEPVLLVGETGCGKTSICEVVARAFSQRMVGVNCHQNMETADLLGSQRPVRNRNERRAKVMAALSAHTAVSHGITDEELLALCGKLLKEDGIDVEEIKTFQREIKAFTALFEWSDGPLVHAMNQGDLLLLDEVSLADDSVLERLNSVLEPGRTLVLAEKGGVDIDAATLVAHPNFHVVATMNPGGDFGKKELSPALRNRFTEIWVPPLNDRADLLQIIGHSWKNKEFSICGESVLDYFQWFTARIGDDGLGLRDILAWVGFIDGMKLDENLSVADAFRHGGEMVLVDGLESLPQIAGMSIVSIASLRRECLDKLAEMSLNLGVTHANWTSVPQVDITFEHIKIGGFGVACGPTPANDGHFRLEAPTTALNAMRVLRGCQLPKAILLEGSPGVGKTSLVSALASLSGHVLQRINLSDQTDLIDLFGSDLPVEGGSAGEFQWRDAAFLDAMQKGHWVLLDEMNLASQTVLEGLNAVLDHRGTVYIPELGRAFVRHPDFRVFAAQNPLQQGGGRKGLPKSFLNRFTKVYLQEHTAEDLRIIVRGMSGLPSEIVDGMIEFNERIRKATMVDRVLGVEGSPWEFNLRDLFRWFELLGKRNGLETTRLHDVTAPVEFLQMVYSHRFRNVRDRIAVQAIFEQIFGPMQVSHRATAFLTTGHLQIGHSITPRSQGDSTVSCDIRHGHLDIAESVLKAIEMGWLVILAGDSGVGKRKLVKSIAEAAGRDLGEFAMHPGVDTSEILGSFEQVDWTRVVDSTYKAVVTVVDAASDEQPSLVGLTAQIRSARDACIASPGSDTSSAFAALTRSCLAQLAGVTGYEDAMSAVAVLEKAEPNSTGFGWTDGTLIKALRLGGWYLISNANLCSASVLDRLNSLCERDGTLVLSEKGSDTGVPEVITPHEGFRLFMTFDPKYGELSRAMRNRGVELYVDRPAKEEDVKCEDEATEKDIIPALAGSSILKRLADVQSGEHVAETVENIVAQSAEARAYLYRLLTSVSADGGIQALVEDERVRAILERELDLIHVEQGLNNDVCEALVSVQRDAREDSELTYSLWTTRSTRRSSLHASTRCSVCSNFTCVMTCHTTTSMPSSPTRRTISRFSRCRRSRPGRARLGRSGLRVARCTPSSRSSGSS